jgi:hypothetical protein
MKKSPWPSLILFSFGIPVFGGPIAVLIASMSVPPLPPPDGPWFSPAKVFALSLIMLLGAVIIGFGVYFAIKAFSVKKMG